MKIWRILLLLIGLIGLTLNATVGAPAKKSQAAPKRWNIISIVTDDQAMNSIGAYGNKEVVTPNMDRLAREGVRFTNAFACSGVCLPSRVGFLTGLFPTQVGLTDVYATAGWDTYGLPLGVPTWPRVLKQHGYVTGLIGKWHLGRTMEFYPTNYGLDYFFGFLRGTNFPMNPVLMRDGKISTIPGSTPDILVDDAMSFIDKHKAEPFALMLHFREPHLPYGPLPEADSAPFKDLDPTVPLLKEIEFDYLSAGRVENNESIVYVREDKAASDSLVKYLKGFTRAYYASIHSVDRNLGRLLAKLQELNLDDNTIILFSSDQGYLLGKYGMREKGAAVPVRMGAFALSGVAGLPFVHINMYDYSYRIPFLVRWPGVVKPGTVIEDFVSNIDAFRSILGMLNIPVPEGVPLQGMDFSPLLRGEKVSWRDAVFAQYDSTQVGNFELIRMVRTKKWKLVRTYLNPGGNVLINLENDPEERKNLYYQIPESRDVYKDHGQVMTGIHPYAEIRDELQKRLTEWQRSINDPALVLEKTYDDAIKAARETWKKRIPEK